MSSANRSAKITLGQPHIMTRDYGYEVRVLYEGTHDRTSHVGRYDTVEAAAAAARAFHDDARIVAVKD